MAGYFPGLSLGETLEQFLDRMVRPDTRYLVSCREVINTVVRLIHKHPSYNIKEVIKVYYRLSVRFNILIGLFETFHLQIFQYTYTKSFKIFQNYALLAKNTINIYVKMMLFRIYQQTIIYNIQNSNFHSQQAEFFFREHFKSDQICFNQVSCQQTTS